MGRKQGRGRADGGRLRTPTTAERVGRAVRLLQMGRPDDAEPLLRGVLRQHPDQPDALHFLGVLVAKRGRHQEGIELIRRALALVPDYVDAWNNLGNLLLAQGELEEAEAAYRKAIALAPDHANAHANLGMVLRRSDRLAEAMVALRQAVALEPHHANAHFHLARVLADQDRHEEAVAAFREAIRANPAHVSAHQALATLLYKLGRPQAAADLYRHWLARDPGSPVARHMLAASSGQAVPGRAADEYVRDLFDGLADSFDEHLHSLQYRAPEWVARAVAARLEAPARSLLVLDAGCGTGLCGPFLRPHARLLTGVDLSPRMLDRARERGTYDELVLAELTAFLSARGQRYDLIVSADTLVYFGALDPVCRAAAGALRPNGWLVFTVERSATAAPAPGFCLEPSGRYSHAESYVRDVLARAGLAVAGLDGVDLRLEGGRPVAGLLVAAQQVCAGGQG